jgi:hypothetical protein
LQLQLFGFSKKEQTGRILSQWLGGDTLIHEMLHFFLPAIDGNSCWSEGVVEFLTFWIQDSIEENLARSIREYNQIKDQAYKEHKYGYVIGFKKMNALYEKDQDIMQSISNLILDFNKNTETKKKIYSKFDILEYNPQFRVFFYRAMQ